ncbi:MAG: CpaD family pilus assembly protein [Sphingomonas sp.]|nr:CpaD family pilus assembly protein [Sphingomonas sp.]
MSKLTSILTLATPALLLSACGGGTINRGLETVHQPVVAHTNYAFDVSTDGDRLAPGEHQRLAGWLSSMRLGYGDKVAVDDPSGSNSGARDEIGAIVADYGMFLAEAAPITAGQLAPGAVRVVVIRSTASVPGCPDYSKLGNHEFDGNTSSIFGCAVSSNLAAMVARPDDLVRGQPGAETADAAVSTKAIQTLRTAPNTGAGGLKVEGTSKK